MLTGLESRRFRAALLALVFAVAVLTAYLLLTIRAADPDMFWHIATGRWIVQNGSVPTTDPFSWWAAPLNKPWVAQEWLFGLIAYGVYRAAGYAGVYWLAALLEGGLALLAYALTRARGVNPLWGLLFSIAVLAGGLGFVAPRPQMLTYVFITLTALLLEKGHWKWALPVVLIGVNVHGGVWPLYVLVFAFYEFPKRWWLVLAATAVTFVNPNPIGVALYPFQAFLSPVAAQIDEFAPTVLWERKGDLLAYTAVLFALHRKPVPWRPALYALAFVMLSLSAIRHVAWFYVVVIPVLAPYMVFTREDFAAFRLPDAVTRRIPAALASRLRLRDRKETHPVEPATGGAIESVPEPAPAGRRVGTLALEVTLVGSLVVAVVLLGTLAFRTYPDVAKIYPQSDVLAYLKLHGAKRIFNVWHEGGYLIMNGVPPMVDGRGDPYTASKPGEQDLAKEYMDVVFLRSDPRAFMKKMNIDYAVMTRGGLMVAVLHDPAFTAVKFDEYHVVFKFDPTVSAPATRTPELSPGEKLKNALEASGTVGASAPTP